jgi:hypothetical protein
MAIPTIFTKEAPSAISSYDWFDSAAGAGYKRFYAAGCNINGSTLLFLSSKVIAADLDGSANIAHYTSVQNTNKEVNFDVTFQNPVMIAGGEAIINYTTEGAAGYQAYTIFTLYHVNGAGTETSIGTVTTSTNGVAGAAQYLRRLTKITTTQTSFGIGEKLRLEVKMYETANHAAQWFYDPSSKQTWTESGSGATIGTDMVIDVPFKIDL